MKRHKLSSAICAIFGFSVYIPQVVAEEGVMSVTGDQDSTSLDYIGSSFRLGIGYGEENQVQGDIFAVLYEKENAALMGEGWFSSSAGGLKLSWNWLPGVSDPQQIIDNPDGLTVYKTFIAADQNDRHDRKITAGFGIEKENYFYGAYLSKSITGRRSKRHSENATEFININRVSGFDEVNRHAFERDDTVTRIETAFKDSYSHPYEWGIGLHGGHFWDQQLIRFRGGLDYEIGLRRGKTLFADNSQKRENSLSGQITASVGIEKYFNKTPFSFAIDVEHAQKYGPEETDKNDTRYLASVRYDFGRSHRQSNIYRDVEVPIDTGDIGAGASIAGGMENKQMVKNTISLSKDAFFAFDKSVLSTSARTTLDSIAHAIKSKGAEGNVRVTGHTCSIGSVSYNKDLSLRRAFSIRDYLVSKGVDSSQVDCVGEGEGKPKYSNKTRDGRSKNRRTDIEFVTMEEAWEATATPPAQSTPGTEWTKELIKQEPVWLRRALRNPVDHKRTVDVYKVANRRVEKSESVALGIKEFANTSPIAVNDQLSVAKNSLNNSIIVLSNDRDPENDTLTIVSFTQGGQGRVVQTNGQFLYTPTTGFVGTDSFTYTVDDGFGGTATATVTVNIESTNRAPTTVNDSITINQDSGSHTISVLANDSDPDGNNLSIVALTGPAHGFVVNNGSSISYTPAGGFSGTDSFTYTVSDGDGGTSTAVVTVNVIAVEPPKPEPKPPTSVNQAPTAGNDSITVNQDSGSQTINVLANDRDPEGDNLSIVALTGPAHGFVVNNGSSISYTPAGGYVGADSFTYTIDDGHGHTTTATVNVNVTAVSAPPPAPVENQAPVAVDDSITVNQDSSGNTIEVLTNDSDPDGDSLNIVALTGPSNGFVVNNGSSVSYTPAGGYVGTDSFTYTIDDGHGHTTTATVNVTVAAVAPPPPPAPVENQAPVAVDDSITVNQDSSGNTIEVLTNDSDSDGDSLNIVALTGPSNGFVVNNGTSVSYTPANGYVGTDSFTYTIDDGHGHTTTATVNVTVAAVAPPPPPAPENQPPVAVDDSITVNQDSSANTIEVLTNDSDPDGDSLNIVSVTDPANGIVVNNNGNVSYTPDAGFVGIDSFTYTIEDGQGHTTTATVTVTVNAVAPPPPPPSPPAPGLQAVDDTFGLNLNETRVLDVLANDTGEGLTITSVTSTRHSIVKIVDGGKAIRYEPLNNWCGTESFTYTLEDSEGNTTTARVTVLTGIDLGHVPGET